MNNLDAIHHLMAEKYDSPTMHLPPMLCSFDQADAVKLALSFMALDVLDEVYA